MKNIIIISYSLAFLFFSQKILAQNYNMTAALTSVSSCGGFFNDSGGTTGFYGPNQDFVTTICSNGTSGTHVRLTFQSIDLKAGDQLCFYDGTSVNAPLISCSDSLPSQIIIQASAANTSGCITVKFHSDGSDEASGWVASIGCVPACQIFKAVIVSTTPVVVPADTGWIDVCPRKNILFSGKGSYPQNDQVYHQSDSTSIFEWNFGDGTPNKFGLIVNHIYSDPGGYYASLKITDKFGCTNTNYIHQRVRVSTRPKFDLGQIPNNICQGDSISLKAFISDSTQKGNVFINPTQGSFSVGSVRSDSLALPDGDGSSYTTSINFKDFSPGQLLTNISDLESICVNMEHSWLRDLEISLKCPDGTKVILHNHAGHTGGRLFLGEPVVGDGVNPTPGVGYNYCWTSAGQKTWLQWANSNPSAQTLPAGDYKSFQPLTNFIGCPLNGDWSITVKDLWAVDNGYIFNWSVNFKSSLYPKIEKFTPTLVTHSWIDNPSILFNQNDSILAKPQFAGTSAYTYSVKDNFGCVYDTALAVTVLPATHPQCYKCQNLILPLRDTALCGSDTVKLDATFTGALVQSIPFAAFPQFRFGFANAPPANPYLSVIDVSSISPSIISDSLQIESVCMDINTDYDGDLQIYLQAPSGQSIELTTNNGGGGDNYTNTCFKPTATTSVKTGTAPFTGDFKPEGVWASLNGANIVGKWKLKVGDGFGPNNFGLIKSWAITFKTTNKVSYSWSPNTAISCTDCPAPKVLPTQSTNYVLTTNDNYGCIHRDTARISIVSEFAAPVIACQPVTQAGQMTFSWSAVPGSTSYEVNINGGGWTAANGNLSHSVSGLNVGDIVTIQVRIAASQSLCPAAVGSTACTYYFCPLAATLSQTTQPSCFNTSDGTATILANNGIGGVTFFVDGQANGSNTTFSNLNAGAHILVVKDGTGCTDTLAFSLSAPNPIVLNISIIDSVRCFGDANGKITVLASGGTGALDYLWTSNGSATPTLPNIAAGTYILSVKDAKNCEIKDTIFVPQPALLQLALQQDSVKCFGEKTGKIFSQSNGGSPSYQYLWSNGETTPNLDSALSGNYLLTVTDAHGCKQVQSATVLQPTPILFAKDSTTVACNGGSNGVASVFPNGGSSPYSYKWNDPLAQSTSIATNLQAGFYQCSITDARNCQVVAQVIINENTTMSLSPDTKSTKCSYSADGKAAVVVTNGLRPLSFKWNDAASQTDSLAVGLLAGDYFVTVTDALGCMRISQVTVAAPAAMSAQFLVKNPLCFGSNDGNAAINISNGIGILTYQWNDNLTQTTALANNLAAGSYTVTVRDANGCIFKDSISITAPSALKIDSVRTAAALCFGENNGNAQVFPQGGTKPYSYQWNDALGQIQNPAVQLYAGNYQVTITDKNGCLQVSAANVVEPQALSATISSVAVRCLGGNDGKATVLVNGGTANYNYKWENNQNTATGTGFAVGEHYVTVTDGNGCTVMDSVFISQPATAVKASVSQSKLACFGASGGEAIANASGGTGINYSYKWSDLNATPLNSNVTAGFYSVTATDQNGCNGSDTITIKQLEEIKISSVIKIPPTCFGEASGKLGINIVKGGIGNGILSNYNYIWGVAGSGDTTIISNLLGGKNYLVTVVDAQGCKGTSSIFLEQPLPMKLATESRPTRCFGNKDGEATVKNVAGGTPNYKYLWDAMANNQTTPTASNLQAGTYRVIITDLIGCKIDTTVVVAQPTPLKVGKMDIKIGDCLGDSKGEIKANVAGGAGGYQYIWSNGDTTLSIKNLRAGNYQLSVTDQNGCLTTATAEIKQPVALLATATHQNITCFGERDGSISVAPKGGSPPYMFSLDGINFNGAYVIPGLKAGKYAVTVRDANGCLTAAQAELTQPDTFKVNAGIDQSINWGESAQLSATTKNSFGTVNFVWTAPYGGILSCENCQNPVAKPPYTADFKVVATDANGCTASDYVRLIVTKNSKVAVPTGFSPNGDFENDLLSVYGREGTTAKVFRIFDRWGNLLYAAENFKVNDSTVGWDGTFRGQNMEIGTYVWYLEVEYPDATKEFLKGDVQLLR